MTFDPEVYEYDISHRIHLQLKYYSDIVAVYLFGIILSALIYCIILFWKEYLICYYKKIDNVSKTYYYNHISYKKMFFRAITFTVIIGIFILVFISLKKREFALSLVNFQIMYSIYLVKYYYFDQNPFEAWNEWVYLLSKLINKSSSRTKAKVD